MIELIQPKEIESESGTFIISKLPATVGREVLLRYPLNNIPKLMSYLDSEKEMLLLMSYVEKKLENRSIRLDSKVMIDQHITGGGWELLKLEWAMMEYNFSFLDRGGLKSQWKMFLNQLGDSSTKMLTRLLDSLSQRKPPHSTN